MASHSNSCRVLELHDDIFMLIVIKMSFQNIFQLRCVCKKWKNLFGVDNVLKYLEFFGILWSQTPIYAVSYAHGFAPFNFETKSWHKWTSALHLSYLSRYQVYGEAGDWLLVEDEPTLVKDDDRFRNLCLVNPTKRSQRKLPKLPEVRNWDPVLAGYDYLAVGLIPGEKPNSCEVFIVNTENAQHDYPPHASFHWLYQVYLYNFELDSWKKICPWQEEHGENIGSIIFHAGVLHGINYNFDDDRQLYVSKRVCCYDEQKSRWVELSTQISGELRFQRLFEWQGHLMLIGGRDGDRDGGEHDRPRIASVHIWQLDKKNNIWMESMKMPEHMMDHFYPPKFYNLRCSMFSPEICGHWICLTYSVLVPKDTDFTCFQSKSRHVMCNLLKRLWLEVPEPPFAYKGLGFSHLIPK